MQWEITIFGALTLALLIALAVHRTRLVRAKAISYFASRVAFPFTVTIEERLDRRLTRRRRNSLVGALLGSAVFGVLALVSPGFFRIDLGVQALFGLYFAACAIGMAVASLTSFGEVAPGQGRIARASVPRLFDYISPAWVITGSVVSGAGIVGTAIFLPVTNAVAERPEYALLASALGIVTIPVLVISILLSRRLLATPQPAADRTQLAWDDALRAQALKDIWTAPFTIGFLALVSALALLGGDATVFLPGAYLPLIVASSFASAPGTRFQRRLWPDTPPLDDPDADVDPTIEAMLHK